MNFFTDIPRQIEEALKRVNASSRRGFLKQSGMLAVSIAVAPAWKAAEAAAAAPQNPAGGLYPDPNYRQLDAWIVIHEDNTATFFVGKTDCGQGTGTAFRQIARPYELDVRLLGRLVTQAT